MLVPATAEELATNLVGGAVIEEGITTHFCPEGHYTPAMMPGSEPCRRVSVVVPGQPALAVVSWAEPGGAWRFVLPAGEGDLSGYTTFSLRAAVDPLSPLNPAASSGSYPAVDRPQQAMVPRRQRGMTSRPWRSPADWWRKTTFPVVSSPARSP